MSLKVNLLAAAAAVAAAGAALPFALGRELPEKASIALDQLEPKVARPVNPAGATELPERAKGLVETARRHVEEKNYVAAIAVLERAAGYAPRNAEIHKLLGRAYLRLRNRGKAEAQLEAAAKAAPDDLETQMLLGQLAAAQRQAEKAALHLRTALMCSRAAGGQDALAGEALLTLSLLLDREGYWTAALEGYTRLSDWIEEHGRDYAERPALREWVLRPERLLSRRGGMLLLLGRAEQAVVLLERAYARDRTNGRTATLLLDALLAADKLPRAEEALLGMGGQPTQRDDIPRLLGQLADKTGDEKLPGRFWAAFRAKHDPDPKLAVGVAGVALKHGWSDQAVSILQSVVAMRPLDPELWRVICRSFADRGRYEGLFDAARRGLEADPNALGAIAESIDRSAGLVETEGVERRFADKARKEKSAHRYALFYLAGRVAGARGKHLLAADLYQRAAERAQPFYRAYEALLDAYIAQKRPDRVDRLLARLTRLAGDTHLPAYFRGKVAMRRGDYKQAVDELQQALEKKADDLPTLKLLVDAYLLQGGRANDATSALRKGLAAHPGNTDLTRRLFDITLSRRQFRDAQNLAAELLRGDRQSIPGRLMMVELALAARREKEAKLLLGQLVRQAPDNEAVQLLSIRVMLGAPPGLIAKKDFDDAAERLRRLLRVDPDSRRVRVALAETLAAVDKHDEAAGLLGELFEEDPGNSSVTQQYIVALLRAGDEDAALRAVERFRERNRDDMWGRSQHIRLLAGVKRSRDARALAERWIRDAQDDNFRALYRQELLAALASAEDHAETLEFVESWISERPGRERLRSLRGIRVRLLVLLKRHDEANRRAEELIEFDPFADAGAVVLSAALQDQQYAETPKLLEHWMGRCREFLARLEGLKEAVEQLAKKKAETSPEYDKALKPLPPGLREEVSGAVGVRQYARVLDRLDRWIAETREGMDELRGLRIIALGEAKKTDLARKEAEAWIRESPKALRPKRTLIGLLSEAKKDAEADRLATKWLAERTPTTAASQPVNVDAMLHWLLETTIRLKISQHQLEEALRLADRHLAIEPNDTDLLTLKSGVLTEMGRDEEAMVVMEAAYGQKPDDASLNNNLGYIYAERGVQLDKAERLLKKARAEQPLEVAFADSEAWVYYKQGRFLEAGRAFQRLVVGRAEDEIEHGVILDHAGDAYYRLGWTDRAVAFWERALALAREVENPTREEKSVLAGAAAKIEAVRKGAEPAVAPTGEGRAEAAAPPADDK